jgi:DNA-binding response OmpR family regulator
MARFLFVDDDPLALTLLEKTAAIYGYEAIVACSGKEAIEIAIREKPDMVVVDMQMQDMDGLSVIRKLAKNARTTRIPTVMLTAGPALDIGSKAIEAGAVACLYKPLNFEELQRILKKTWQD